MGKSLVIFSIVTIIGSIFAGSVIHAYASPPPNGTPVVGIKDSGNNVHFVTFFDQLFIGTGTHCDEYHYHALNGVDVVDINGVHIPDPAPEGCGYGIVGTLLSGEYNNGQITGTPKPGTFVTNQDFRVIPVIVNIYPHAGVNQTQIGQSLVNANKVLSKINAKAVIVKQNVITGIGNDNGGDDGSNGGTAGDGVLNGKELLKAIKFGSKETAKLPGGKGLKISFVKPGLTVDGTTTPGVSIPGKPTAILESRATSQLTGATIAHEFGHIFGIDHPVDGSAEDTPGDIMTPSNGGRDDFVNSNDPNKGIDNVGYTNGQSDTIKNTGYLQSMSNQGATHSPGQKKHYQGGTVEDDLNDTNPSNASSYLDIDSVRLNSLQEDNFTHGFLSLNGLFPTSGRVNANYSLVFNTDANNATGQQVGSFNGIDGEVVLHVERENNQGPLLISGLVVNYTQQRVFPLVPTPRLYNATLETDNLNPSVNQHSEIQFDIRKADLNYSANNIPVGIMSRTQEGAFWTVPPAPPVVTYDTTNLVFNTKQYASEPTLTLDKEFAFPGNNVPFTISGLVPNSSFTLKVNETTVVSNSLNSSGGYSGSFTYPSISTHSQFVIAQDSTGNFTFNFINPECSMVTGDNTITSSCILPNSTTISGNLVVSNNSLLIIPNGMTLDMDLVHKHITVKSGSGILIKSGGKIR